MQSENELPSEFGDLLRQLEQGDPQARGRLIERAHERLRLRVHQMLGQFPGVHRWEDTSDVLHDVLLDLHAMLAQITPNDSKHFLCLAAMHIRWKLLDLTRAVARIPKCEADLADGSDPRPDQPADNGHDPRLLAQWTEIHDYIQALPEAERELFDLLFYHGINHVESAKILGMSYRTLKRRWQAARLAFMEHFGPEPFLEKDSGPK
jgi:RNA polymerase sigma factor (sigma-70 family)